MVIRENLSALRVKETVSFCHFYYLKLEIALIMPIAKRERKFSSITNFNTSVTRDDIPVPTPHNELWCAIVTNVDLMLGQRPRQ